MTNKLNKSLVVLIATVFYMPVCFAASELDKVLDNLKQVQSSEARFVEVHTFSFLKEGLTSKGILTYKKPDVIRKQVTEPKTELFEASGDYLKVQQQGGEVRELLLQNYPLVATFVNAYRGILSGDKALLMFHFETSFSGDSASWRITLTPKDDEVAQLVQAMMVEGAGKRLTKIIIKESGGDQSVMRIIPD